MAKKSKDVADVSATRISAVRVESNTPDWRKRVNEELDARGRGARAELVRHLKARHAGFSTGQLTELLGPDEKPGQKRYSQYKAEIDEYLWPSLLPLSRDTHELKHLLDGISNVDVDLLQQIKEMDRDEQRALAQLISTIRKPK